MPVGTSALRWQSYEIYGLCIPHVRTFADGLLLAAAHLVGIMTVSRLTLSIDATFTYKDTVKQQMF
jgi:hypothetical protein